MTDEECRAIEQKCVEEVRKALKLITSGEIYDRNGYLNEIGIPMDKDLISREALINVILDDRKLDGVNANWEVNRILVHIKKAPPAPLPDFKAGYKQAILDGKTNFSRPQGKWTQSETDRIYHTNNWRCSNCNSVYAIWNSPLNHNYNFCPNCGADMRGDEE